MNSPLILDKTFKNENYSKNRLIQGEYDTCSFINCDFSDSYVSNCSFIECEFIDCNFSLVKSKGTTYKDVTFTNCKLLGFPFNECNSFLLALQFKDCQLHLASFYNLKLKGTNFINCKLEKVDFSNSDLSNAQFKNCDLHLTTFENTNLENADFQTSFNFNIDPELNVLKQAKFSKANLEGLLYKHQIKII